MLEAGVDVGALFMPEHADGLALKASETADNRLVLGEFAVAGQRREVGDEIAHIMDEMRALVVPRHLRFLPRRQIGVNRRQCCRKPVFQPGNLFAQRRRFALGDQRPQFIDLGLQFGGRFFKIEE